MRNYILALSTVALSLGFSSCYNCVECTDCEIKVINGDSVMEDSSMCYRDAKEYYLSRKEWRDDVKAYEQLYKCQCQ
ncbi:MAG: hypothetical protein HN542_05560 [Flavobacteriales bacterium]|nr:hypothetical protein [Flavobacteriales bacterium]NCG29983.1 hypothetical protein [Bacteroidota bacterium]MBT3962530.1 hypothetical protein [Flavobacteriales bacterium]MBT4705695.1 hypothetical protein [Flavobacteriales bacterium]MBT4930971.1 hypothetical protein [Flavobacteriales bacterium]